MLAVVAPVLHLMLPLPQPLALRFAVSPLHKLVLSLLTTGALGVSPFLISMTFDTPLTPHRFSHVAL